MLNPFIIYLQLYSEKMLIIVSPDTGLTEPPISEMFNFLRLHFIPNLLQNSWIIKLHCKSKSNKTRNFCFFSWLSFTKTTAVDNMAYSLEEKWVATFVTQNETDMVFFTELFFSGSRSSVGEDLSSSILILSQCNNMWCLRPHVLQTQRTCLQTISRL